MHQSLVGGTSELIILDSMLSVSLVSVALVLVNMVPPTLRVMALADIVCNILIGPLSEIISDCSNGSS